jgi:hypothetical protein
MNTVTMLRRCLAALNMMRPQHVMLRGANTTDDIAEEVRRHLDQMGASLAHPYVPLYVEAMGLPPLHKGQRVGVEPFVTDDGREAMRPVLLADDEPDPGEEMVPDDDDAGDAWPKLVERPAVGLSIMDTLNVRSWLQWCTRRVADEEEPEIDRLIKAMDELIATRIRDEQRLRDEGVTYTVSWRPEGATEFYQTDVSLDAGCDPFTLGHEDWLAHVIEKRKLEDGGEVDYDLDRLIVLSIYTGTTIY